MVGLYLYAEKRGLEPRGTLSEKLPQASFRLQVQRNILMSQFWLKTKRSEFRCRCDRGAPRRSPLRSTKLDKSL